MGVAPEEERGSAPRPAKGWALGSPFLILLAGCSATLPDCPATGDTVAVVSHGWHTDLAIPARDLAGGLARFRRVFPGLHTLVVGFGRRTFLVAPVRGLADYLVGPFPGNGALEVVGLAAPPATAYGGGTLARLHLTPDQTRLLDDAIWSSFASPTPIASGPVPGGLLYAARPGYSALYTCNGWTADMLSRAGLPVSPELAIFAGQTMARAAPLTRGGLCAINPPR